MEILHKDGTLLESHLGLWSLLHWKNTPFAKVNPPPVPSEPLLLGEEVFFPVCNAFNPWCYSIATSYLRLALFSFSLEGGSSQRKVPIKDSAEARAAMIVSRKMGLIYSGCPTSLSRAQLQAADDDTDRDTGFVKHVMHPWCTELKFRQVRLIFEALDRTLKLLQGSSFKRSFLTVQARNVLSWFIPPWFFQCQCYLTLFSSSFLTV